MKILGITKLVSKKGSRMAKVQVERPFSSEEINRLELASGKVVEDLWLYEPLMDRLDSSSVGKDLEPVYSFISGRPTITDLVLK